MLGWDRAADMPRNSTPGDSSAEGKDPSPVTRRLMKAPSRDTLSPGERAAFHFPVSIFHFPVSDFRFLPTCLLPTAYCLLLFGVRGEERPHDVGG